MTVYLICYDIIDNRERNRVARVLENHGRRVQDSVFELHRLERSRHRSLMSELRKICSDPESVRIYRLTQDGLNDSIDLAGNRLATRPSMVVL